MTTGIETDKEITTDGYGINNEALWESCDPFWKWKKIPEWEIIWVQESNCAWTEDSLKNP